MWQGTTIRDNYTRAIELVVGLVVWVGVAHHVGGWHKGTFRRAGPATARQRLRKQRSESQGRPSHLQTGLGFITWE